MPISTRRLSRSNQRGFTIIELLVVILIIGILIAVASPSFLGQQAKAQDSGVKQYLTISYKALKADSVSNPAGQGVFEATPASAASAVIASEPQLTSMLSASASPTPGNLGVCSTSATRDVLFGQSKSGALFVQTVSNGQNTLAAVPTASVADAKLACVAAKAQAAAGVYASGHGGSYVGITPAALIAVDPSIPSAPSTGLSSATAGVFFGSPYYSVTAGSFPGATFTVTNQFGPVATMCTPSNDGGLCTAGNTYTPVG